MTDIQKQITNLKNQNHGMETSFTAKNIQFTGLTINDVDLDTELMLLTNHNMYLKSISAANRPPPQAKTKVKATEIQEQSKLKSNKSKSEDIEDNEDIDDVKPVFSTITNMEDIKRTFFNKDYELSFNLIKQHPFKFYEANYKYSNDYAGSPDFVARNLIRGFVQGFEDYRKYFMVCFRCILVNKDIIEYKYPSYWIVNSNDDLHTILGSTYNDYEFVAIKEEEAINKMFKNMEKNENNNDDTLIGEIYLH